MRSRREKVFGPGRAVPLDGNAKARIPAYARAWSGRNRQPGQHKGPITRAFLDVLEALLWGFHNSRTGCCFPSYEAIAAKAECARSTVAEALKVLELAGVLSWQHRIARALVRQRDLFGRWSNRWTMIRTSNAYVFSDPQRPPDGVPAAKSENPPGTLNQDISILLPVTARDPDSPLERALHRFGQQSQHKKGIEQGRRRQHGATDALSDGAGRSGAIPQRRGLGAATRYDQAAMPQMPLSIRCTGGQRRAALSGLRRRQ